VLGSCNYKLAVFDCGPLVDGPLVDGRTLLPIGCFTLPLGAFDMFPSSRSLSIATVANSLAFFRRTMITVAISNAKKATLATTAPAMTPVDALSSP